MPERALVVLPVFNEVAHVHSVLDEVRQYSADVLVVDDGSSDGTSAELDSRQDIMVERHHQNRGYGAALKTGFDFAAREGFDFVVTIDCDGQHQPRRIPRFISAIRNADLVSGSRYLKQYDGDSVPPGQRRWINQVITAELNDQLGLSLTDAFCGFKAYRVAAIRELQLTEPGYAMPLELWVRVACAGLKVIELPVPLIYLDASRSFGGVLDDGETRLAYYREVIRRSLEDDPACRPGGETRRCASH